VPTQLGSGDLLPVRAGCFEYWVVVVGSCTPRKLQGILLCTSRKLHTRKLQGIPLCTSRKLHTKELAGYPLLRWQEAAHEGSCRVSIVC
jgi:hypothetical protein